MIVAAQNQNRVELFYKRIACFGEIVFGNQQRSVLAGLFRHRSADLRVHGDDAGQVLFSGTETGPVFGSKADELSVGLLP